MLTLPDPLSGTSESWPCVSGTMRQRQTLIGSGCTRMGHKRRRISAESGAWRLKIRFEAATRYAQIVGFDCFVYLFIQSGQTFKLSSMLYPSPRNDIGYPDLLETFQPVALCGIRAASGYDLCRLQMARIEDGEKNYAIITTGTGLRDVSPIPYKVRTYPFCQFEPPTTTTTTSSTTTTTTAAPTTPSTTVATTLGIHAAAKRLQKVPNS